MYEVKQSTALTLPFFAHDISGDAVTGLTDGSFTKRISKNGAAFGAMTVVISELENGWYSIPLSSSHSDTLGILTIVFTNAGAKQINLQFRVEAKLIDDLNDVAATDIVSAGAITTLTGAVVNVDTVDSLTANADKTGYSLSATGLDAITQAATGMIEIAKAVWDRVLTGATHNIADSGGRRLRDLQEFGVYEGGAIWIDTINGSAGTTDFESGTAFNPVDTLVDATTLATSLGITRFQIAPNSTITLGQTYNNFVFMGDGWTLALGGRDVGGTHFHGATVSGTGTGSSDITFEDCVLGTCTLNPTHAIRCGLSATITFGLAGGYLFDDCHSAIAGMTTPIMDTGAGIANVNLSMPDYHNGIEIQNLNTLGTDTFSISGIGQIIYAASSSGSVNQRGDWKVTNTGGVTITADDNTTNVGEILTDTNELQTDWTNGGRLDLILDIIAVDTTTDIPALIAALNDISVADILTTQMTESYAADGVAPTLAQALFLIQQQAGEFAIISTTLTVKKLDGSTAAATFTLDDATNPTSRTRAT